jgi:hypothetical protein
VLIEYTQFHTAAGLFVPAPSRTHKGVALDRDSFPQLLQSDNGWPQLVVPWGHKALIVIVSEDTAVGSIPVVNITTADPYTPVRVRVNGAWAVLK